MDIASLGFLELALARRFRTTSTTRANVAAQSEDLFTNAFQGMTEALVEFATTGKTSFKELALSIIADLVRIRMQAALTQIFGSVFSGANASTASASQTEAVRNFMPGVGRRAAGGPVDAGRPYIVGERGPELIVPRQAGMVVPNHRLGGNYVTINQTLHAAPGTNVAQFQAMLEQSKAEIRYEIIEDLSRGRLSGVME